jgi:hypothetical protein
MFLATYSLRVLEFGAAAPLLAGLSKHSSKCLGMFTLDLAAFSPGEILLLFYPWNPRHPVVVCKFFIFLRISPQEIRRDTEGGIDKLGDSFTKRGITNGPPESRGFAFASRFLACKWLSVRFAIYLTNKIEELVAIQ